MVVIRHLAPRNLGTRSPYRGPRRRRGESSDRIVPGKGLTNLDETDSQTVPKLGDWARQSGNVWSDRGAGPPLIGKVSDVLANVGVELPGAAIHGGLLPCRELRIGLRSLRESSASKYLE